MRSRNFVRPLSTGEDDQKNLASISLPSTRYELLALHSQPTKYFGNPSPCMKTRISPDDCVFAKIYVFFPR